MILALEASHGSGGFKSAGVADGTVVLDDLKGNLPTLARSTGVKGTGLGDVFQHAFFLDALEDGSSLDEGIAVAVVSHDFRRGTGGRDFEAASVEDAAVGGVVFGGDLCVETLGRCCEAVGEDSGGEFVHEVAFFFFALCDCVTGAFTLDVV